MDIEEFYEADARRQTSDEVKYGTDWTDAAGGRYEAIWIADTGEVYAMFEPIEPLVSDAVGDIVVQHLPTKALTVEVLGHFPTRDAAEAALAGWEAAMAEPGSIAWLRDRVS
ncbi:MAG: hypothetical protein WCI50_06735 [Actinomycetes bacterium]